MNYGLWLSAGGVLSSMHRQDVAANNLANVETIGFKPDMVIARQRAPERIESATFAEPQWLLERLGGGHFIDPMRSAQTQGSLSRTGNTLDVAIEGDGLFVVASAGATAPEQQRFTRDGRFTIDERGRLVMAATGLRVLGADGQPITLNGGENVEIDARGTVRQGGATVGRLRLVAAAPEQITKAGENLFRLDPVSDRPELAGATGRVRQGFVETSAVDPIVMLNQLIAATKAVQSNAKLMQYHDSLMGQAIGQMGRV